MRKALQLSNSLCQPLLGRIKDRQVVKDEGDSLDLYWFPDQMLAFNDLSNSLLGIFHRKLFILVVRALPATGVLSDFAHELVVFQEAMSSADCFRDRVSDRSLCPLRASFRPTHTSGHIVCLLEADTDRKSTRLNSSHRCI